MNFDMMECEVEFERIRRAFDVAGECEILTEGDYISLESKGEKGAKLRLHDGAELQASYSLRSRTLGFTLWVNETFTEFELGTNYVWYSVMYNPFPEYDDSSLRLVKGLFHLGLLTPEIERGLRVSISAHQKLEWTLEYEARYEL